MKSVQHTIERIQFPDRDTFFQNFVSEGIPVILTDLQNEWEARKHWNPHYFGKNFGKKKVGTMSLRNGVCDADTYSELPEALEMLSDVIYGVTSGNLEGKVVATPTGSFGPELNGHYAVPFGCDQKPFFRSRIYIGPMGTVTPLHQDLPENLYTLIYGHKRITLFAPEDSSLLYRNHFWSKHPNFSRVNPEYPDFERFTNFSKARPIIVELKAGDTLLIPSFWWHHLRNLEPSIAMSFWWPEGWRLPISWAAASYKKLTSKFP